MLIQTSRLIVIGSMLCILLKQALARKITSDCVVIISDETSTRNWNRESKISQLFLVLESENFNRISDSKNDSLKFVCLQLKLQSKNIGT